MFKYFCLSILIIYLGINSEVNAHSNDRIDSLIVAIKSNPKAEETLELYSALIPSFFPDSVERSYYYTKRYHQLAKRHNNKAHIPRAIYLLAEYYYFSYNYTKAKEYFIIAYNNYKSNNDLEQMADMKMKIGLCDQKVNEFLSSLQFYQEALNLYKELQLQTKTADVLQNIGIVYIELAEYDLSLRYYEEALEVSMMLDNQESIAALLQNIGSVYNQQGELEKALNYYNRSLKIFKNIDNQYGIAGCYNNIGLFYENKKDYSKALEYYHESHDIFNNLEDWHSVAILQYNLGSVNRNLNNQEKALQYFYLSLDLSEKYSYRLNISDCLMAISDIYSDQGEYNHALEYYKKHIEIKDILYDEDRINQLTELEIKYQSDQKEKLIGKLEADSEKQKLEINRKSKLLIISLCFTIAIIISSLIALRLYNRQKRLSKKLFDEVSDHKETSNELNQLNKNLEKIVADRTKEIEHTNASLLIEIERHKSTERDLEKARDLAEESDRLKSAFLANISHEIRTPMNAIVGFSQMLTKDKIDKSHKSEYSKLVIEGCNNLTNIIDNILDFSSLEIGNIDFKYTLIHPKEVIEPLFNKFSKIIKLKRGSGLNMNLKMEQEDVKVMLDKFRVSQVLDHLLDNAIKFTHEGAIDFGFYYDKQDIIFYVKDSGIGIKEDHIDTIFENFRQIDEGTTRKYDGAGLGLSISKRILELMKGEIWVESEEGKGSVFYVRLYANKHFTEGIKSPKDMQWSDKTVLIAEDKQINFELIKEMLRTSGANIIWAKDGQEALDLFKEHDNIDLILLDIQMPKVTGYDVVLKIRSENTKIPIIAQTAYALADDRKKIISTGCNEYISKPISYNQLIDVLSRYLN